MQKIGKNGGKRWIILATLVGLVVGVAAPAMALENEFHFLYRARGIASNFDDGGCGPNFQSDPKTKYFVEQLGRFNYTGSFNSDLKVVSQFDIAFIWGDGFYGKDSITLQENAGRNKGGGLASDTVNFKTKALYVDYKLPTSPVRVKIGLQPFHDAYKATVLLGNAAGVVASAENGRLQSQAGWFRLQSSPEKSDKYGDFFLVDERYKVSDKLTIGGSYYAWKSDWQIRDAATDAVTRSDDLLLHYLGINAEGKVGNALLDGFFIYSNGTRFNNTTNSNQHVNAFAANLSGRIPAGPGTVRAEFLYNSGDSSPNKGGRSDFTGVVNADGMPENYFYHPEMLLLFINQYAIINNRNVIHSPNNDAAGVIAGFLGYDLDLTKELSASANAGFAAVAKNNKGSNSDYIGTELSGELAYKLSANATARVQGGYVILGDFLIDSAGGAKPANPYTARLLFDFYY